MSWVYSPSHKGNSVCYYYINNDNFGTEGENSFLTPWFSWVDNSKKLVHLTYHRLAESWLFIGVMVNLRKVHIKFKISTWNCSQPFGVAKQGWKANRNKLFHEIFLHQVGPEILQEQLFLMVSWHFCFWSRLEPRGAEPWETETRGESKLAKPFFDLQLQAARFALVLIFYLYPAHICRLTSLNSCTPLYSWDCGISLGAWSCPIETSRSFTINVNESRIKL